MLKVTIRQDSLVEYFINAKGEIVILVLVGPHEISKVEGLSLSLSRMVATAAGGFQQEIRTGSRR
jgi:hypothetical protein